jgi:hypothetical protein
MILDSIRCWQKSSGRKCFVAVGLVALSGKQTYYGDIFIQSFPVEAAAAKANVFALFGCGAQETWKPRQRHADDSTVSESDPHAVLIEMDSRWADVY